MPSNRLSRHSYYCLSKNVWVIGLFLGCSSIASAKNGFIPHYVGMEGIVAGAGTANPLDVSGVIANPAAPTRLPSHIVATLGLFSQNQHVDSSKAAIGNPIARQRNRYTFIPIGTGWAEIKFNERWMFGFALTGGGGFVRFKHSVSNRATLVPANSDFNKELVNSILLAAPTLAYMPSIEQGYGISLLIAYSNFKSDIALANGTEIKGHLRSNKVMGIGTRIGGLWDFNPYITLGASIATPVFCQLDKKYKQLFIHKFQIPATLRIGITWHITPKTDFSLDFKELFYGWSKWVKDGQGWHNQPILLTGITHKFTDNFMVGIGYNYGAVPFRKKSVYLNTLSIPLDEHHISGGFNQSIMDKKIELFAIAFYIPKKTSRDNGKGLAGGISKGIKMDSYTWGGELGVKWNF